MNRKLKQPPVFKNEAQECRFWETNDSSDYMDWSRATAVRLPNLWPSTTSIPLRLPCWSASRLPRINAICPINR